MPGARSTTNPQITGLVSGHPDKAARIAAKYGIAKQSIYNYENFDEIAHNPAIDAVYVELPPARHALDHGDLPVRGDQNIKGGPDEF